jgi:hypothetical protein
MKVDDAISHYGSAAELAKALKLAGPAAVSNWKSRYRGKIPELYARRLHEMTRGKLKFDRQSYSS